MTGRQATAATHKRSAAERIDPYREAAAEESPAINLRTSAVARRQAAAHVHTSAFLLSRGHDYRLTTAIKIFRLSCSAEATIIIL